MSQVLKLFDFKVMMFTNILSQKLRFSSNENERANVFLIFFKKFHYKLTFLRKKSGN